MRRLKRRFKRPKRPYDSNQIAEGKDLKKTYGLRRKKEIWIAQEILRGYRQRARKLTAESNPEREAILLQKLAKMGLLPKDSTLDDVLGLSIENLLDRRLETVVHRTGLTRTPKQARQAIVHGHVSIGSKKISFPSYIVTVEEEGSISSTFKPQEPEPSRGMVKKPEGEAPETSEVQGSAVEEPAKKGDN